MMLKNKGVLRIAGFVFIFACLLGCVNFVLTDKGSKKNVYAFRYEKSDTIDVVFLGTSHANNAFLPMELWEDYGYTTYSLSQMSQTFPLVYYCAEDAVKLQHPDLLVVDLFAATSYRNDFDNMHKTVDNLTFSTRMLAIEEFVPEEKQTEYRFPLYLYHDRWDSIEVKDFIPYFLRYAPKRNARKGATLVSDWKVCERPDSAIEAAFDGETSEFSEEALYWYSRLKQLRAENSTELLFVSVPYQMPV